MQERGGGKAGGADQSGAVGRGWAQVDASVGGAQTDNDEEESEWLVMGDVNVRRTDGGGWGKRLDGRVNEWMSGRWMGSWASGWTDGWVGSDKARWVSAQE